MAKKQVVFNLITDAKALGSLIKSIGNRGKLLDRDLHQAAVSALFHAYTHRSTAATQQLLDAMGKAGRKGALKTWLFHFGCFEFKEDGKTLGIVKAMKAADFDKIKVEAIDTPFWELTADKDDAGLVDAMAAVQALVKRLTKANTDGKLDADGASVLAKLSSVVPAVVLATQ